jgi:transposase-like protein
VHVVELSVMEQRYQAVMAVVQDGWKVTEVADRLGVTRQAVHKWSGRYEAGALAGLADRSPPRHLRARRQGVDSVPGRSSTYRCLKPPQSHRAASTQEAAGMGFGGSSPVKEWKFASATLSSRRSR